MKLNIIIGLFIVLGSCSNLSSQKAKTIAENQVIKNDSTYIWTKLLESADWRKSYNFQMFSINDTLWTFHPEGTWHSTNGKIWSKSALPNSIYNLAFLDYVHFKDAVYGLGYFEGNIEQFKFKPEIYKTTDFKQWETISKNSNLPNRFFYHPFVFENKIWIIGGEDKNTQYADIWNSADGIVWEKQKDNLPFGKRSSSQIVDLNGTLFLINNDVWSSTDGLNWQKVTDEILKGQEVYSTAIVYDNRIWLIGCNRNGKFSSEILASSDGKNWEGQDAPWSPRGGIAATVHKGKLYMTGGKYGGFTSGGATTEFVYSNDVWTFGKKE